jgi:hypothetical protein
VHGQTSSSAWSNIQQCMVKRPAVHGQTSSSAWSNVQQCMIKTPSSAAGTLTDKKLA